MTQITSPTSQSEPARVSAADLSRVIRRMSNIFATGDMGNYATSEALLQLADYLHGLGAMPVEHLHKGKTYRRTSRRAEVGKDYGTISLAEVDHIISERDTTKEILVRVARSRFGIPESRLRRLPTAAVADALKAAAAHEESLNLIAQNAEASGKARQS